MIKIGMRNEEEDFFRILWWNRRKPIILTVFACFLISFVFVVIVILEGKPRNPENDRRWIIYLLPIIIPLFASVVAYFALKKRAKKMQEFSGDVTVSVDEEGLSIEAIKGNSDTKWIAFDKVVETAEDFIFYIQPKIFFGNPKRFFDSEGQIIRLKTYLKENLGDRAILRADI